MSPLNITQPLDSIRYMVYNGYYKVMSNIPKMGHLTTPVIYVSIINTNTMDDYIESCIVSEMIWVQIRLEKRVTRSFVVFSWMDCANHKKNTINMAQIHRWAEK